MDINGAVEVDTFTRNLRRVCEQTVGPAAAEVDRSASNPVASWRALWEIGGLRMRIPRQFGGLELSTPDYIDAIETLAQYCAASAMTVHMHSTACTLISAYGTPDQQAAMFGQTTDQFGIFGSWGSEPSSSFNAGVHYDTILADRGARYAINGHKHFCTMAGAATHALVWCALEDNSEQSRICLAFVPRDAEGMRVEGTWDPLGMRGTVSPATIYEDCSVPRESVLTGVFEEPPFIPAFSLGFAAVLSGIAEMALNACTGYCQKKTYLGGQGPISQDPTVKRRIGELAIVLQAALSTLRDSAVRWDRSDAERRAVGAIAKHTCGTAALHIVNGCMQIVGGNAVTKKLPFERAYRDARTVSLMPPNLDLMELMVGTDRLGDDAERHAF
jgi:alkylation response protein AidB-like acyl-CoA dehydrogenase